MSSYNTQLQSNNTDLQMILQSLQNKTQATPEISVGPNGLITATAGSKSSTYQLAFQEAKTIIPGTVSQIAVSGSYFTGGNITVAGDSNLIAENIKSGVSIFGISGTATDDISRAIIERTITEITDDKVQTIGPNVFVHCYSLTTALFPACTSIGTSAFYRCVKLATVSFPACTNINPYAFQYCSSLTTASFPVCKSLGIAVFSGCSELTTALFPVCTNIGQSALRDCYNLTTVSFPACTVIGGAAFQNDSKLTTASFPVCNIIGAQAFQRCYSLTTALFPACTNIGANAFGQCQVLSSLILSASSVCILSNSNAFYLTPFAGYSIYFSGTPHIYVPASLINSYKTATNWVFLNEEYFRTIENMGQMLHFTIGGTAEIGEEMLWTEWVVSEYNVNGYRYNDATEYIQNDNNKIMYNGVEVKGTDLILNQGVYTLEALEENAPE